MKRLEAKYSSLQVVNVIMKLGNQKVCAMLSHVFVVHFVQKKENHYVIEIVIGPQMIVKMSL